MKYPPSEMTEIMSTLKAQVSITKDKWHESGVTALSDQVQPIVTAIEDVLNDLTSMAYCMFKLSHKLDKHIIDRLTEVKPVALVEPVRSCNTCDCGEFSDRCHHKVDCTNFSMWKAIEKVKPKQLTRKLFWADWKIEDTETGYKVTKWVNDCSDTVEVQNITDNGKVITVWYWMKVDHKQIKGV